MSTEAARLSSLVADFGEAMRQKLWKKQGDGRKGWNDDSDSDLKEFLQEQLLDCIEGIKEGDEEQYVDVANFCAMLWNLKRLDESRGTATRAERQAT